MFGTTVVVFWMLFDEFLNVGMILRNDLSLKEVVFYFNVIGDAALLRRALMNEANLTSFYGSGQIYDPVLITERSFFTGGDLGFE